MLSRLLLTFALLASVTTVFCQAETTFWATHQRDERAALKIREQNVIDCKFVGNADFYGIGVRIGFYLLWLAGFLDFAFNPQSSVAIGDSQTIFDFANLVAIIVLNNQQPPIGEENPDRKPVFVPIILLYMFFGGAIVSATTTASFPKDWLHGDKSKRFSTLARQLFVHSTFLGMMGYALYFFVSGYRNFDLFAPCTMPEEGPRLFPLSDPVSFKHSPIVGLVLMPLILALYVLVLYIAIQRYNELKGKPSRIKVPFRVSKSKYHKISDWLGSSERQLSFTILGSVLMFTAIVWCITAIEWTIVKNEIQGVNDISFTGQLIPFIIGLFSLPTTLWGIYKNRREEKRESNEQKEESEIDTPLKHLNFTDVGLESPNGVYMAIQPQQHKDQYDSRHDSQQDLREARTF